MSSVAVTIVQDIPIGDTKHLYEVEIVPSSSYPTNGEPIDAAANRSFDVLICGHNGGYGVSFDKSTQKAKIYRQKDPGNAGGADIPGPEVANGVDLSGQKFRGIAIGS